MSLISCLLNCPLFLRLYHSDYFSRLLDICLTLLIDSPYWFKLNLSSIRVDGRAASNQGRWADSKRHMDCWCPSSIDQIKSAKGLIEENFRYCGFRNIFFASVFVLGFMFVSWFDDAMSGKKPFVSLGLGSRFICLIIFFVFFVLFFFRQMKSRVQLVSHRT